METCKYIKREGASCSLNNNCKYPNCNNMKTLSIKSLEKTTFLIERKENIIEIIQNSIGSSYFIMVIILKDGTVVEYHYEDTDNPIMEKFKDIDAYEIYCGIGKEHLSENRAHIDIREKIISIFRDNGNTNIKEIYIESI